MDETYETYLFNVTEQSTSLLSEVIALAAASCTDGVLCFNPLSTIIFQWGTDVVSGFSSGRVRVIEINRHAAAVTIALREPVTTSKGTLER